MRRISPWLILAGVILAVAALLGGHFYASYYEIEKREHDRLIQEVNFVERNLAHQLQIASDVLQAIRDEFPEQQPAALNRHFQAVIGASSSIRSLAVVDRAGDVSAGSRAELLGKNFRNQGAYEPIRAANDPSLLHISGPFLTPLGLWSIALGRSIRDDQGNFAGCVLAIVDPEYFDELLSAVTYAPDVRVGLTHGLGKIIYRVPDPEGVTGQDLSEAKGTAFYQHLQSGEVLTVLTVDGSASGQRRMVASRTVWPKSVKADQPLVAFAGREMEAIFAQWQAELRRSVVLVALFALAAMLGLSVYLRRQAALDRLQAERQAAEERLRLSDERMRLATDGADIGVWYWDQVTGKLDWSAICKRHFGLPEDQDGSFEHFFKVLHPDDREYVGAVLKHSQEILEDYHIDYRVVHPDGAELWLAALGRYYLDEQGKVIGMGGVTLDISERKRAELTVAQGKRQVELLNVQLERRAMDAETAKRAKEGFLRVVSHELLTPLNHITGGVDLLLRGRTDAEQQQKWLQAIKASAGELLRLINQVLVTTRAEGGEVGIEQLVFDPATVLHETLQMLAQRAEAKGLALKLGSTADLPAQLIGDPTRLAQALLNYIDNGIKFTDRGSVTVSAQTLLRVPDGYVLRFEVSDTGIGIAPEEREKLFSVLTVGDSSLTRRHGGMGIGLANTRQLAMLMGGDVGVASEPGQGSSFWFTATFKAPEDLHGEAGTQVATSAAK